MKTPPSSRTHSLDRLERAIAHQGLASRREAKDLIKSGGVKVNGKVIREPGYEVNNTKDVIAIKSTSRETKETVMIYKPRGIETTATLPGVRDVRMAFTKYTHLSPIGRLDKDSEGLLILSNDGTLASALTKIDSSVGKTYKVTVREIITDQAITKMKNGIMLSGVPTKPAEAQRLSRTTFSITLYEGRKHQIRRMCDACKLTITSLVRVQIGQLKIRSMNPGSVYVLTAEDIQTLKGKR